MLIVGVDPGASGAAAMIGPHGNAIIVVDFEADPAGLCRELDRIFFHPDRTGLALFAVVERAQAMPKQGVSSTASYMKGAGVIEGYLIARGVSYDTVRPSVWKKAMGLSKTTKDSALAMARRLFPTMELDRKKDHNRAEALLLAEWCRRTMKFGTGD